MTDARLHPMTRESVKSTNIRSIGFEKTGTQYGPGGVDAFDVGTMEVEFAGGDVWQYYDVPIERYAIIKAGPSVGSNFHRLMFEHRAGAPRSRRECLHRSKKIADVKTSAPRGAQHGR